MMQFFYLMGQIKSFVLHLPAADNGQEPIRLPMPCTFLNLPSRHSA